MPTTRVEICLDVEHPEKVSNNLLSGVEWEETRRAAERALGAAVTLEKVTAVPGGIRKADARSEHPA